MQREIWKLYLQDDFYEVSNLGRVRLTKNKQIKQMHNHKGYLRCRLRPNESNPKEHNARVHRMVMDTFAGHLPYPAFEIDHLNGDTTDNRFCNLQYVSELTNIKRVFERNNRPIPLNIKHQDDFQKLFLVAKSKGHVLWIANGWTAFMKEYHLLSNSKEYMFPSKLVKTMLTTKNFYEYTLEIMSEDDFNKIKEKMVQVGDYKLYDSKNRVKLDGTTYWLKNVVYYKDNNNLFKTQKELLEHYYPNWTERSVPSRKNISSRVRHGFNYDGTLKFRRYTYNLYISYRETTE